MNAGEGTGLVILHIDGLSYEGLQEALRRRSLPFVRRLLQQGYEALPFHSGIPSTTPYVQAGLLYGDNSEIPGFRWWDKGAEEFVHFGIPSTFKRVAHKYFQGCEPLLAGGVAIAACFPGGAAETFGIGYHERPSRRPRWRWFLNIARDWLLHPENVLPWLYFSLLHLLRTAGELVRSRILRRGSRTRYALASLLDDMVLHRVTRLAALQAMSDGYPIIYACFYAYDEASHAFGPMSAYSRRLLRHVDRTVRIITQRASGGKGRRYEVLLLSDHGQIRTVPFRSLTGHTLGQAIADWFPALEVREHGGVLHQPAGAPEATVYLAASGGLAHLYVVDIPDRMNISAIRRRFPRLIENLVAEPGIGFVMGQEGGETVLFWREAPAGLPLSGDRDSPVQPLLRQYGDPAVLACQLARLNRQQRAGDLIIFGAWNGREGTNFEPQVGGHGSTGGDQTMPFLLVKKAWQIDTSAVTDAADLHPILTSLRASLAGSSTPIPDRISGLEG
jgi:hypothetical protein